MIGIEFAGSLIETMRMASAVFTESVDEQMLPVYDQAWLSSIAESLDGAANVFQGFGLTGDR